MSMFGGLGKSVGPISPVSGRSQGRIGVPAQQPATTPSGLPDWAHHQVVLGGGDPNDFVVHQGQLMRKLSPEQEKNMGDTVHSDTAPVQPQGAFQPMRPSPAAAPPQQAFAPIKPISNFTQNPIGVSSARNNMTAALHQHFNAASERALEEPDTVDVTGEGNYVRNTRPELSHVIGLANAINAHENADPNQSINMLRQIASDPNLGPFYLASQKADPATMAMLPRPSRPGEPAINDQNFHQQLLANPTLAASLSTEGEAGNMGLLERLQHVRNQPGIDDPTHPNHQALQSWINQQYANPQQWNEATYVPPDPNGYRFKSWLGGGQVPGFLMRPAGLLAAMGQHLFGGADETSTGTGPGWDRNFRERADLASLLRELGIQNPADIPRNIVGRQNGQ